MVDGQGADASGGGVAVNAARFIFFFLKKKRKKKKKEYLPHPSIRSGVAVRAEAPRVDALCVVGNAVVLVVVAADSDGGGGVGR